MLGIAIASNVRFDIGPGFTVPTQAVFVPMLLALPPSIVPLLVVPALALGMAPDVLRGRIAPSWLLTTVSNSWFALGPALVFVLAGESGPDERFGVLALALVAQFAFDFTAAAVRDRLFDDDSSLAGLLLGDVVEADDSYTGLHSKSVVRLALELAVPNEIIDKPGKLDEREWEIVKTHTIEGLKMLERIGGFMAEIGVIVRASHEAWDGSGYPDGLRGEEIPIEARTVSVCDSFNAITTTRSYRAAMPVEEAVAEVRRCAGSHFDPGVAAALLRVLDTQRPAAGLAAPLVDHPLDRDLERL